MDVDVDVDTAEEETATVVVESTAAERWAVWPEDKYFGWMPSAKMDSSRYCS
jgi:hypothetical protein